MEALMRNIRTPVLLAATLWLFACGAAGAQTATEKAHALFDGYSEWQMRELPGYATMVGDHRYDDRLTDFSEAAIARRKASVADFAKQLQGIDRNALANQDRISYAVFCLKKKKKEKDKLFAKLMDMLRTKWSAMPQERDLMILHDYA